MKADEIVAHNGDNFDIKWLYARFFIHGIPCAPEINTLDTLKMSRKRFRFNSHRLDYISKISGFGGKMVTPSGLWDKVCFEHCQESLQIMVDYCDKDVIELEKVYQKMKEYFEPKFHYGVKKGGEKWHCPECGSVHSKVHRVRTTARGTERYQMKCSNKSCGSFFTISARQRMKMLEHQMKGQD